MRPTCRTTPRRRAGAPSPRPPVSTPARGSSPTTTVSISYPPPPRDAPAGVEPPPDGQRDLDAFLEAHRGRIKKLADGRLHIPAAEPYMEGHNTWCANRPGSLLLIPVGDIAQHL